VVLKIAVSSGSRGIYIVNGSEELRELFAAARRYQPDGAILVEEYVCGSELSIEGFSISAEVHIVQTTDKLLFPGRFPVEAGHTQPSRLTPKLLDAARSCAAAGVSALGLTDTAFHAEVIVNGQGARLIEIGARLGGDRITTHLTPLSTGVNMVRASIVLALGGRPDLQRTLERGSAIRYMCAPRPGTLSAVKGVDALWCRAGVEFVYAASERDGALRCGFTVPAIKSSGDRYGHLIFSGATAEEAASRVEDAVRSIRFEYAASDSDYRPNAAAANV
jgi:biotin carboxylase